MRPLTPAFLVAAAGAFVGLREQGQNRGPMIDIFLAGVGLPPKDGEPGEPWCAAFVHHVGKWSHYNHASRTSSWPLPPTASCYQLGQFAKQQEILRSEPLEGDVFLLWSPVLIRFAHTGVIVDVRERGKTPGGSPWFDCVTIEGNTNDTGGREGWGVLRKERRFYTGAGDRFIRWADLDRRPLAGNPLVLKPAA